MFVKKEEDEAPPTTQWEGQERRLRKELNKRFSHVVDSEELELIMEETMAAAACLDSSDGVTLRNLRMRDSRCEQIRQRIILEACPGSEEEALRKIAEYSSDEQKDIMPTSKSFLDALDQAEGQYYAHQELALHFNVELQSLHTSACRMLRGYLARPDLSKTAMGSVCDKGDHRASCRASLEEIKMLGQGDEDEDVNLEMRRVLGTLDPNQGLPVSRSKSKQRAARADAAAAAAA